MKQIKYEKGDKIDLEVGIVVLMGDRKYQALPLEDTDINGLCTGCFGFKCQPVCNALPKCCDFLQHNGLGSDISVIWKDVTEVAY